MTRMASPEVSDRGAIRRLTTSQSGATSPPTSCVRSTTQGRTRRRAPAPTCADRAGSGGREELAQDPSTRVRARENPLVRFRNDSRTTGRLMPMPSPGWSNWALRLAAPTGGPRSAKYDSFARATEGASRAVPDRPPRSASVAPRVMPTCDCRVLKWRRVEPAVALPRWLSEFRCQGPSFSPKNGFESSRRRGFHLMRRALKNSTKMNCFLKKPNTGVGDRRLSRSAFGVDGPDPKSSNTCLNPDCAGGETRPRFAAADQRGVAAQVRPVRRFTLDTSVASRAATMPPSLFRVLRSIQSRLRQAMTKTIFPAKDGESLVFATAASRPPFSPRTGIAATAPFPAEDPLRGRFTITAGRRARGGSGCRRCGESHRVG